jgi:hypothetical protein
MMFKYEIKGITLNELDLMDISLYYNICRTAEYLMDNYDLTEDEAMKLGADVRRYMDKNNVTEDIAIAEVLTKWGGDLI